MKKKEDEVEKLIQLSVLMGMGIATVFHFLRKICGSEKENVFKYYIYCEGALEILFLLGFSSLPPFG